MILLFVLALPLAGGVAAWLAGMWWKAGPRWIALGTLGLELVLLARCASLSAWGGTGPGVQLPWIPRLGMSFHLGMDGLSLALLVLTTLVGIVAVIASWESVRFRTGFFHCSLLASVAAMIGVFLARDLFLFYVMWELMLIPLYFIMIVWGEPGKGAAAIKLIIFTQGSGLFMLLGIVGLYFLNGQATGLYTFDYGLLLKASHRSIALWGFMLCFFAAFAVKLGIVPLHGWLPDAYAGAPAAGSILLAGAMAKAGAYGLIRFLAPLFAAEWASFSPIAMALGAVTVLYGAALAFAQTDLKRLIAYGSISHMGLLLLGAAAQNGIAAHGVVVLMVSHGVSVAALFMIAGMLRERLNTVDLGRMGGLWASAPRMGGFTLLFALSSIGLPGLGNFIGEFLILAGAFHASIPIAAAATAGVVISVVYSLYMIQRIFQGRDQAGIKFGDLSLREFTALTVLALATLGIGLYPKPILHLVAPSKSEIQSPAAPITTSARPPVAGVAP